MTAMCCVYYVRLCVHAEYLHLLLVLLNNWAQNGSVASAPLKIRD